MRRTTTLLIGTLLVACSGADGDKTELSPPASGQAAAGHRSYVEEAPISPSAARAADVVRTYFRLLGERKYREAWNLWSSGGQASGMSEDTFAESMARYRQYRAIVGSPGRVEGAAGSLFVEVPLRVSGRKAGNSFEKTGSVTLRRCNDVPGCTEEQLKWRIAKIDLASANQAAMPPPRARGRHPE